MAGTLQRAAGGGGWCAWSISAGGSHAGTANAYLSRRIPPRVNVLHGDKGRRHQKGIDHDHNRRETETSPYDGEQRTQS